MKWLYKICIHGDSDLILCPFTYIEEILNTARNNTISAALGKRDVCANPVDVNEFNGSRHVNCVLHPH